MKTLGLCIADVAGKGMPAALLMSNLAGGGARTLLALRCAHLLCARLNSIVCRNTDSDRFITFFYAQLTAPRAGLLRHAGHNPPFVMRSDARTSACALAAPCWAFSTAGIMSWAQRAVAGRSRCFVHRWCYGSIEPVGRGFGEVACSVCSKITARSPPMSCRRKSLRGRRVRGGRRQDDATLLVLSVLG